MSGAERVPVSVGMKFVALLLIVGGALGIALTLWLDISLLSSERVRVFSSSTAITGAFIVLYGWGVWTGIDLWRGRRQAITMAQVLFAMQIPVLNVLGFSYEFHTGLAIRIMVLGGANLNFNFQLGSSFNFYISSQVPGTAIGVNLFALAILIYLTLLSSALSNRTQTEPPIPSS
jgi:hypothetical protein